MLVVVLLCLVTSSINTAVAEGQGLQLQVDEYGLQQLTYNGVNYLSQQSNAGSPGVIISSASFIAPNGSYLNYGWSSDTLNHDAFTTSSANRSVLANGTAFQHIYGQGGRDSITFLCEFTIVDPNSLDINIYVTNNDPQDSLALLSISSYLTSLFLCMLHNNHVLNDVYIQKHQVIFSSCNYLGQPCNITTTYPCSSALKSTATRLHSGATRIGVLWLSGWATIQVPRTCTSITVRSTRRSSSRSSTATPPTNRAPTTSILSLP